MRFPVKVFTDALVGYNTPYTSSALNQKFAGQPKGVYIGFTPSTTPGSPFLTLSPSSLGYSLLKVHSALDSGLLDLVVTTAVVLDFTGHVSFPVQVVAQINYATGAATTATLITRTPAPTSAAEVSICTVYGAPLAMTASTVTPTDRDEPLAHLGSGFGFMPAGAVEDLDFLVDKVNEVVAARLGLDNVTYPTLSDRIAADYSALSMASRLGRSVYVVRSNNYSAAGDASVNVSGSFAASARNHLPLSNFSGSGDETVDGVITGAPRNVCTVVDRNNGTKFTNTTAQRSIVYGRIQPPVTTTLTGTLLFTNSVSLAIGTGTVFTSEVEAGDIVQAPSGDWYEVSAVTNDTTLVLTSPYAGTTASTNTCSRARWLLTFHTLVAEVESSFTLTGDFYFLFPTFSRYYPGVQDNKLHAKSIPKPDLPVATTTTDGKVLLATPGALVGAVYAQNNGVAVPGGPFHTINFVTTNYWGTTASPASAVDVGSGEVSIQNVGDKGQVGNSGAFTNNPGPQGPGFTDITPFIVDPTEYFGPGGVGTLSYSSVMDMGHNVRCGYAGFASVREGTPLGTWSTLNNDYAAITDVTISGTEITANITLSGDTACKIMFCSAGD